MSITVWQVIFSQQEVVFNYTGSQMITYIFLAAFLQSLILATALNGLASRIYSGQISFDLIKPVNIFAILSTEDIADKLRNVGFLILETILLWQIFKPEIIIPSISILLVFALWVIGGIVLNFLLCLLFGALGFWSPDIWGPRFLFFVLVDLAAGKLFPLDIMPEIIQNIVLFTPFPYFAFLQSQLFLERLNPTEIVQYSLLLVFWIFLFSIIVHKAWKKGTKDYAAAGQ
jgi:ABC-2 type transport system permease protein